ncbi:ATP-dependent DNA ligase [Bradyrhizobium sp. 18BD]
MIRIRSDVALELLSGVASREAEGDRDQGPFPGFIEPVLAEQVDRVLRGDRWVHEIKFDGYRGQLHIANHDIKIFTRRGLDWTKRFRKVANDADLITAKSAIIDGEIVVPGEGGKTDFAILQKGLTGKADNLKMIAFDLLYLDGRDLRQLRWSSARPRSRI